MLQDAHNCIPEFDEETAMFAVYDGHGGNTPTHMHTLPVSVQTFFFKYQLKIHFLYFLLIRFLCISRLCSTTVCFTQPAKGLPHLLLSFR